MESLIFTALKYPIVILLLTGLLGGIVAGMLGVGGGIIIVPVLYFLLKSQGYEPNVIMHLAVATSLSVMIVTSVFSTHAHYNKGAIKMKIFKRWAPYLAFGVLAGSLSSRYYSGSALVILFAIFALLSAVRMGFFPSQPYLKKKHRPIRRFKGSIRYLVIFSVGFFSSLMGIGGGTFTIPLLVLMGSSMHQAIGTSASFGLFISFFGTFGFAYSGFPEYGFNWPQLGYIQLDKALWLSITSMIGAKVGAYLTHKTDHLLLQRLFAFFLGLTALRMAWDFIKVWI